MTVAAEDQQKLGDEIRSRLERLDGVDTREHGYLREEQRPRLVASFSVFDPEPAYRYWSPDRFRLMLNDSGRLTLRSELYGDTALVSDLDEVVRFVRDCRARLERQRALRARNAKVRGLLAQGIVAQVRKLARAERFDFLTTSDAQKLKLYVRLSEAQVLELQIPFREFKTVLPQLPAAIRSLRALYESGIRFQVTGKRGVLGRETWITHESLAAEEPARDGEAHSGSSTNGRPY